MRTGLTVDKIHKAALTLKTGKGLTAASMYLLNCYLLFNLQEGKKTKQKQDMAHIYSPYGSLFPCKLTALTPILL